MCIGSCLHCFWSLIGASASEMSPLTTTPPNSLSTCLALFSHSTYHHLTLYVYVFMFVFLPFTYRLCEDSVLFIIPPPARIENYSGMDPLNGGIQKCMKYSLGQTMLYTSMIRGIYMHGGVCARMCIFICVLCCFR